jgi:hypothetical protein
MTTGKARDRLAAATLLLARTIGPPMAADVLERLQTLEAAVLGRKRT